LTQTLLSNGSGDCVRPLWCCMEPVSVPFGENGGYIVRIPTAFPARKVNVCGPGPGVRDKQDRVFHLRALPEGDPEMHLVARQILCRLGHRAGLRMCEVPAPYVGGDRSRVCGMDRKFDSRPGNGELDRGTLGKPDRRCNDGNQG